MPKTRSLHNKRGQRASVIDFPKKGELRSPWSGPNAPFVLGMAESADSFTKWGQNVGKRDRELRDFWPTESTLAGAVYMVCSRNAGFEWVLDGPEKTKESVEYILNNAITSGSPGWMPFISSVSQDLYATDNGAFIEIIRKGPSDPVIGIAHLDSYNCLRTGNPDFPVIYRDRKGKLHKMPWFNVISLTDMPSPIQRMNGVGMCAVSRVLRAAQIMRDIAQYKHEKVSGQFYRAIHFIGGVAKSEIEDVQERGLEDAQNQGLTRYIMPLIIASLDPEKPVSAETIELASLPENFDVDQELKWYINTLALGLGTDYQDLAPLPGGGLGTGAQSEVLHKKANQKGSKWFMDAIIREFRWRGVIPRNIEFDFIAQDLAEEQEDARLRKLRAEERSIRLNSGEIDFKTARKIAEKFGDFPDDIDIEAIEDPEPGTGRNLSGGSAGGSVQGEDNMNRQEKK